MFSIIRRYCLPGLVFQGVVIGGGYATGRELVEFFGPVGPIGGLLGMAVTAIMWAAVMAVSFELCRMWGTFNYRDFFEKLIGPGWVVFELLLIALMIIVLAVVSAAAGEIFHDLLGVAPVVGVTVLVLTVAILAYFGNKTAETFIGAISLFLVASYVLLVIWTWHDFGPDIQRTFSESRLQDGWFLAGLRYGGYNLACVPVVFFCLRTLQSRKQAVTSGVIAGVFGMIPAVCLYVAMMAKPTEILQASIPSAVLLDALAVPAFKIIFQIVVLATLLQTGLGLVHAVNERVDSSLKTSRRKLPGYARGGIALAILLGAFASATLFGLVALIAKGYGYITFGFIATFVAPVLTLGVYRLFTTPLADQEMAPAKSSA
ncbi:YkvI family membrane protein [Govanella unica]|uniref:Membrane protein YkvI n=1 Tax=Govanella unica TaxID=2975056 RepID=A0A9X3Z8W4_9PROT|nr:hypothetical protein [Govania unica]MDA5195139.1 hypothetical protein [Govania unica]